MDNQRRAVLENTLAELSELVETINKNELIDSETKSDLVEYISDLVEQIDYELDYDDEDEEDDLFDAEDF